jgi:CubicO group peptidase (beta-lactamase class C family)
MTKKILSIIIISILLGCSFGVQGLFFENSSEEPITANLGDVFFNLKMKVFMKLGHLPSLSACIIDGNEVIWLKGYGFYDLENRKPATDNTIYNIASISKTVTGTALMQLWEQDLFDLDEDVNNFLPFNLRNPNFPDIPITFRMLLSHSSSLNPETGISQFRDYIWSNFSADPPFSFFPMPWLEQFLIPGGQWYKSNRWSSTYKPGEYTMYSNVNFDVTCYLVELISGEIFVEYCKNHIFQPLEMYNTSFNLSELDINNVAIPYHYHNGEYLQINELSYLLGEDITPPDKYWRVRCYAAGGLYTTISDLSHFLIAHMNGGIWNDVRILEERTVEEMHTIQPPGNIDPVGNLYHGLAWTIQGTPFDVNVSGHNGGNIGVVGYMSFIPSEEIGIICFYNSDYIFETNTISLLIDTSLIPMSLFKKGGFNFISHIDLGNIGAG